MYKFQDQDRQKLTIIQFKLQGHVAKRPDVSGSGRLNVRVLKECSSETTPVFILILTASIAQFAPVERPHSGGRGFESRPQYAKCVKMVLAAPLLLLA